MNANRYMRDSLRTADRSNMDRLKLECALGLCGEAGEVAEQVKKHFFHGHELDKRHMIEELGDVAWYLAVLCDAIGSDLDTVMEENLKKLEQRVEQVWNRCFFYICSARKPLIFKTFSVVFRERNRWNRCKYTFFLLRKKYIRNVYIRNCPFYLFHAFQSPETT